MGVYRNWAKRLKSDASKPEIRDVEAFLDGKAELFQANKPGPFVLAADMTGPLTVQLLDSQGNVVAQVPVYDISMTTGVGGRVDLSIGASFHQF